MIANNKYNKNAVPVIVDNNDAVRRISDEGPLETLMNRRYGIIDMTWIQTNEVFATLSINGTIQIYKKESVVIQSTTTPATTTRDEDMKYMKQTQVIKEANL